MLNRLLIQLGMGWASGVKLFEWLLQAKNFHGVYQDPTTYVQVPLQVAAEREIARYYFQKVPFMLVAAQPSVSAGLC